MGEKEPKSDFSQTDKKLILAFVLVIAAWALHLNLSYVLMPESCENRSKLLLHAITGGCLVVVMIAAMIAWRTHATTILLSETLPSAARTKWMAMLIVALAAGVMVVIVAQEIPNLILRSCD